ncbi:MAG: hypothetical protein JSU96_02660 [Acidobacteriota bacterium]|nr:MAG: hypothetical protein JSU96_02660 [Acidobacteriota bacterium]
MVNVELGSFFQAPGPTALTVNDLMFESLDNLPIQILNLTSDDLHVWDRLSSANLQHTQIVSTNLLPPASSRAALRPYRIVAGPAGARIAILGLADPASVKPRSGFRALSATEAIDKVYEELKEQADFWIVLGDIPPQKAEELADRYSEIYGILLMQRQYRLLRPWQVNNAVICESVERGRYLGQLTLHFDDKGEMIAYEPRQIQLSADVPEDPALLEAMERTRSRLR